MLCEKCGAHVPEDALTCDNCGTYLAGARPHMAGVEGMRQGRAPLKASAAIDPRQAARVYDEYGRVPQGGEEAPLQVVRKRDKPQRKARRYEEDAGRPTMKKGLPNPGSGARRQVRAQRAKPHHVQRHMVNWAHVSIGIAAGVILLLVGAYFYLDRTLEGQKMLVRAGREGTAEAHWQVGEEYLDQGYIDQAIACFLAAREMELAMEPKVDNIDGLLMLGSAYEANGMAAEAEALYVDLYTRLVPTRPEAYRNVIRMMLAQGRGPEAGALMQLAYEKTGLSSFKMQRQDYLPKPPETSLTAGRYNEKKTFALSSPQAYDIYYTLDPEAQLPQEGLLYQGPVRLEEGSVTLRAVAVSGDLVSDPLTASYTVIMPSPASPLIRLAPNTYTRRQKVYISPGDKNEEVTIYYTVDGSTPDADSPVYTGEPVSLATGRVTMKAIAVNAYGKSSNVREVSYKITVKPYPKDAYTQADTFAGFELMKTTQEAFEEKYGKGAQETPVTVEGFTEACRRLTYDWGYAVFARGASGNWMVCQVYMTQSLCSGPRGSKIGDSLESVIDLFKDMGQLESPSGNRGLYEIEGGSKGKLYKLEDGSYSLQYRCYTTDSSLLTLTYHFTEKVCDSITTGLTR